MEGEQPNRQLLKVYTECQRHKSGNAMPAMGLHESSNLYNTNKSASNSVMHANRSAIVICNAYIVQTGSR